MPRQINRKGSWPYGKRDCAGGEAQFDRARLLLLLRLNPELYYGLSLLSAVDTGNGADVAPALPRFLGNRRVPEGMVFIFDVPSSLWRRKRHYYLLRRDALEFWIEVEGQGKIDRLYFSRGTLGERELASVPGFTRVFSPMPNFLEKNIFHVSEYTCIGAGNDDDALQRLRAYGLHGAPLCFSFHNGDNGPALAAGILAQPGEYDFYKLEINHLHERAARVMKPICGTQALSLAYLGCRKVDGFWRSPRLWLRFAHDNWAGMAAYLERLRAYGGVVPRAAAYAPWTRRPIFCTWHEQVALALKKQVSTTLSFRQMESLPGMFDFCTQAHCRRWLRILAQHGLRPGIFIIDAKWQRQTGDPVVDEKKFPDLRGFIDELHRRGIKVLLWYEGWGREGIPDEECLRAPDGKCLAVNPCHPDYQARVRRIMRRLLSDAPGCYNADGIKLDGMTATPVLAAGAMPETPAGFELARALLALIYKEAHAVKSDCAIGQFTAFPYFADLCDLARTGDLYTVRGDPISANAFRARVQRMVMPRVAIDSDGTLRFNYLSSEREVLSGTPPESVPCLYQAEYLNQRRDYCLPLVRRLDKRDYAVIKKYWQDYRRKIGLSAEKSCKK